MLTRCHPCDCCEYRVTDESYTCSHDDCVFNVLGADNSCKNTECNYQDDDCGICILGIKYCGSRRE